MINKFKTYLFISAICHSLLIIIMLYVASRHGQDSLSKDQVGQFENSESGSQEKKVIPKIEVIEVPKNILGEHDQPKKEKKDECKNYYGGIGILVRRVVIDQTPYSRVTEVYEGYPAHKAGIMIEDLIYSQSELTGEPGTIVKFTVLRNGSYIEFELIREKICVEN